MKTYRVKKSIRFAVLLVGVSSASGLAVLTGYESKPIQAQAIKAIGLTIVAVAIVWSIRIPKKK